MTKAQIRKEMRELRDAFTLEDLQKYNVNIQSQLMELKEFIDSPYIYTYISFENEVDTHNIIHKALQMEKEIRVPKVEGKQMNFYKMQDWSSLVRSKFGILEPSGAENPLTDEIPNYKNQKVMLLPGLAFDLNGNRVGYGAGYYDRYLSENQGDHFIKIALAYDFQILNSIETEEHDWKVDMIITPSKLFNFNTN